MSRHILLILKGNDYVSEYSLKAEPVLAGYSQKFDELQLREIGGRAMVSMAIPKGGEEELEQQLKRAYQSEMPGTGQWLSSGVDHNPQFLRLQDDMCFVLFDYSGDRAVDKLAENISKAYLSDQSDSWAMLSAGLVVNAHEKARSSPSTSYERFPSSVIISPKCPA